MPKLTKRIVDDAIPHESPYFLWCSELPGFGVRVFPTGKRIYYADYRNTEGTRRRMSLGHHGKLTTEEARKEAMKTLGGVLRGEDPVEERTTRRSSLTVAELCDLYVRAAEAGLVMGKGRRPKKASTLATDRGRIDRHIKPLLGRKLVRDLKQADINKFIRDVTAGKTAVVEKTGRKRGKAIVEGGAGTAARTAGLLGGILSYAVSEGTIPFNPAQGVKRPADGRRAKRLDHKEFRQLGKALQAASEELETEQVVQGVWLLALTGCRLGEIETLKWSEVDPGHGCFRLVDSKEGASVRPVGHAAFDVLREINKRKGCPFVLPAARSDGHFGGMPSGFERIAMRAKLTDVTPHTLRHSFASVAGDLGYSESTIGALLGHAAGTVTSRYVHHLDSVLIAAADRVAQTICDFMLKDPQAVKRGGASHANTNLRHQ
jgi:integrase